MRLDLIPKRHEVKLTWEAVKLITKNAAGAILPRHHLSSEFPGGQVP